MKIAYAWQKRASAILGAGAMPLHWRQTNPQSDPTGRELREFLRKRGFCSWRKKSGKDGSAPLYNRDGAEVKDEAVCIREGRLVERNPDGKKLDVIRIVGRR